MFYLFQILSKLSIKNLHLLSDISYRIVYYFFPYRNKIITKNLKQVFPEKSKKNIKNLKKSFYAYFLDIIFETIKLLDFSEKDLQERVNIENPNIITREKKKSIIIISGHYSNWEWLLATISIFWKKKTYAIYKPLSNKFFNKLIFKIRTKFGAKMLKKKHAGRFIIKNAEKSNIYFFLSDQVPENLNNVYRTSFLKENTCFSTGVERLSLKTNASVFYAEMKKIKKGFYTIEFFKINNNITQKYIEKLEKTILQEPQHWLWSHNRWKR